MSLPSRPNLVSTSSLKLVQQKILASASLKFYDSNLDLEWIRPYLPIENDSDKENADIDVVPLNGAGGLMASMYSVTVTIHNSPDNILKFIYKTNSPTAFAEERSQMLGLGREALFYDLLAPTLVSEISLGLPKVYASRGNMKTGQKDILIEDLSLKGCQSGLLFGSKVPINYGRDVPSIVSEVFTLHNSKIPSPEELASLTLKQLANLHRYYWNDIDFVKRHAHWLGRITTGICSGFISDDEHDVNLISNRSAWETLVMEYVNMWK